MFDQLRTLLTVSDSWSYVIRIGSFYILAWLVHRLAWPMAGRIVRLICFTPRTSRPRPERLWELLLLYIPLPYRVNGFFSQDFPQQCH